MKIDISPHVVPEKYKKALGKKAPHLEAATDRVPTFSTHYVRETRFVRKGHGRKIRKKAVSTP